MSGWKRLGMVLTITWFIGIGSAIALYWEEIGPKRFDGYEASELNGKMGYGYWVTLDHYKRKDPPPFAISIAVPLSKVTASDLSYGVETLIGPSKAAGLKDPFPIPYDIVSNPSEPNQILEAWIRHQAYVFFDKSEEQLAEIERLIGIAQEEGKEALIRFKTELRVQVDARDQEKLHVQLLVAAGAPTLPPLALLLLIGIFNWVRRGFSQPATATH